MGSPKADAPPLARLVEPTLDDRWPADGFGAVAALMALLPDPCELEPGAWVGVAASAPAPGRLARLLWRGREARLAVRCTALLAKGFEEVGAGTDELGRELAWGRVPLELEGPASADGRAPGTLSD